MLIKVTKENLSFFEALASEARLKVIDRLSQGDCNIKELAQSTGLSSAIMTKHIKQLEEVGIIKSKMIKKDGSIQKMCTLLNFEYRLSMPVKLPQTRNFHEVSIPIGHYTDYNIIPTCGIANEKQIIGHFDEPRDFLHPEHVTAQILWFGIGYVEYKIANYINVNQHIKEIEISMEISSEAPGYNDNWPSDISFIFNNINLGYWTSPGDFGKRRGILTPGWWEVNQYGMLKTIRINREGVFLDGNRMSYLSIDNIDLSGDKWTIRFEVSKDAQNVGGVTLFGEKFGNYNQNIVVRTNYDII